MATKNTKKKLQFWGTGRRKKAVARVRIMPGSGTFQINKRSLDDYFGLETLKLIVNQPLVLTETAARHIRQRLRRRFHRSGRCDPSRHRARSRRAGRGQQARAQESRLPYSRPSYEGEKEVRSQKGEKSASVLQEIINGCSEKRTSSARPLFYAFFRVLMTY